MKADQAFYDWFEPIYKQLAAQGETIIFRERIQHVPMLLVFGPENKALAVPFLDFGDIGSKNTVVALQKRMTMMPPDIMPGVVFVSETWVVGGDRLSQEQIDALDDYRKTHDGIADHPDRREALMFNAMRRGYSDGDIMQLMVMYEIDRTNQKLVFKYMIDPQDPAQGMHDGRMIHDPTRRNPQ
jgi:hypothetical protein